MHYALKDKKISIWTPTTTTSYGVSSQSYAPKYSNIWAYYRFNAGSALYEGGAVKIYDENATAIFIINRRPDIKITDLVTFNDKVYEITRIDDYEGYADDLKLTCKVSPLPYTFNTPSAPTTPAESSGEGQEGQSE